MVAKASGVSHPSALPLPHTSEDFPLWSPDGCSCSGHLTLRGCFPEKEGRDIQQGLSPWHVSFIKEKSLFQDFLSSPVPLKPTLGKGAQEPHHVCVCCLCPSWSSRQSGSVSRKEGSVAAGWTGNLAPCPLPIAQTQFSLRLEHAELQKKEGAGWFSSPAADMDYGPEVSLRVPAFLRMKTSKEACSFWWRAGSMDPVVSQQRWIT